MHEHVHLYELPSGTTYSVASTKFRSDFGNVNNHHSVFLCWFFTPIGLFCGSEKLLHDLNCWLCLDRLSQICRFDFAFFFFFLIQSMVAFLKDPSGPPLWEENPEAKDVVHIETEKVSTNLNKLLGFGLI